jgi:membrane-associated phospholipid phosphatase
MLKVFSILSFLGYFWTNRRPARFYFESKLDKKIKPIPIFLIFYVSYYFLIIFSYIFLSKTVFANDFFLSILIANLMATVFWYFVPNGVSRPKIKAKNLLTKVLRYLYENDGDSNGFPSAHIYVTLIITYYLFQLNYSMLIPYATLFILIALSTIFTKQHYLIDIFGGVLFAVLAIFLTSLLASLPLNLL